MQLEEWKHLQVQNEKREERDKLEGQALLQIREQIEKLRQSNENLELELSNRLEALESKLRTATDKMLECWEIERKEKEEICKSAALQITYYKLLTIKPPKSLRSKAGLMLLSICGSLRKPKEQDYLTLVAGS